HPERESVLYGAAGVAHHAGVTRLLLERGADPNDEEVPYHSPESDENSAFRVLLESRKLTLDSLACMLLRKTDWHDLEGVRLVLDAGAEIDRRTRWGKTALYNSLLSDNRIEIVDLLLDRGADATIVADGPLRGRKGGTPTTSVALAAQRGRGD